MKNLIILLFILLSACGNKQNYPAATEAFGTAREFLDGCMKGEFEKAHFYLLHDVNNDKLLKEAEKNYKARSKQEKNKLKEASLHINSVEDVTPTETIVNYSNSFNNISQKVKVIFKDDKWQVDFKYTFNGNL